MNLRTGSFLGAVLALLVFAGAAQAAPPIVFSKSAVDNLDIFQVKSDGEGLRRLTRGAAADFDPAWSPNHKRIVFSHRGRLYTMRANGKRKRRIRHTKFAGQPSWSPNGKWIAYETSNSSGTREFIYRIKPNGKRRRRLATGETPSWSPSGKSILYSNNGKIRKMRANGRGKRVLFENGTAPDLSPDGERIAFVRDARIFVADPDGSSAANLTADQPDGCDVEPDDCGREDDSPSWDPSGSEIAYTQVFPAGNDLEGIHTISEDGVTDVQVTTGGESPDW